MSGGIEVGGEPEASDSMRTFGAFVQGLREHAGMSREELGERVHLSKHSIASIELGRRLADEQFVEMAEPALGNTGALRKAFGRVGRQPGFAAWFRRWAALEQEAVSLATYECRLVPGLLQSEPYARAVFGNSVPPLSDEQVDARVAARMERQHMLRERPNTSFSFVMDENIVRRHLGGVEVVRKQLDHLLGCAQLRNVAIQVMPTASEVHAGLGGPLALLETPDGRHLAYAEGQLTGQLISDPKDAAMLHRRYATLRSQALSPLDSVSLLERIRGEL
ncbi:Scr1 family TA system antitoxin-like transcriptional regulator [Streptomyces sp. NPDC092369]|uniref:helix-turn-helix domain-containing protein n=1 Tax=Streptomyces sp. NPDC092369 TaxID=3366015 RepID=UPI0037FB3BDD